MAKYELKTKVNDDDVMAFLNAVEPENRRLDALTIHELMTEITQVKGKMWGKSIVGFGKYSYTYASGHSGEWMAIGFSPRKQSLTLYIMPGFDKYEDLLNQLGKHKIGKSCLYINKLDDIDLKVLKMMIQQSYDFMMKK
ncbi:DUF1801 domain-containing protein [Membranihabitans marinus]|uniref:DUF1801 domain-containing protein n=1 Tax=Membranihabitans marinus TaxID=1227546 RepID=UPI001F3E80CC|nr:DUF1801 domain-containing protein [Membranihabitans marinus]